MLPSATQKFLGVDFSGDHRQWRAGCSNSCVWLAELLDTPHGLTINSLMPVQSLYPSSLHPFDRLAQFLQRGDFDAAAIDAPFSIPEPWVPTSHAQLLTQVRQLPVGRRRFPTGRDFVVNITGQPGALSPPKPLRQTEMECVKLGVNTRSTLWNGPRGGAPMTVACLRLLIAAGSPLWPWNASGRGLVVEAFPAAQLAHLGLPYQKYAGLVGKAARAKIIKGLSSLINFGHFATFALANENALDAVICALAARAVHTGRLAHAPVASIVVLLEGRIAVHR